MKLRDIMTSPVISVNPKTPVAVAARQLAHYNIGMLPVCKASGEVCGVVTDRDLVTRCLAAEKDPERTEVGQVMTGRVLWADAGMEVGVAARLMGEKQIRRLPVMESGRLCGMVSLGDLADLEEGAETLSAVCENTR